MAEAEDNYQKLASNPPWCMLLAATIEHLALRATASIRSCPCGCRYPELVVGQLCDFLGVQADSPHIKALQASQRLPYKVVPAKGRGTVAFQLGKREPVTIEEAVVRKASFRCALRPQ